jgi:hypothetical protein
MAGHVPDNVDFRISVSSLALAILYSHKSQILGTDELNRWPLEETIVFLTYKSCIFNGLMRHRADICICANDSDVIFSLLLILAGVLIDAGRCSNWRSSKGNVLPNENTNAYPRKVKTIQESLDIGLDISTLLCSFVFQHSLGCLNVKSTYCE